MMSDTTQADYRMEIANATLLKSPEFISLTDSYPMYIRKFQLTRTVMTTDIRIYVTEAALDNIFVYISPNLDALGNESNYYFEISTSGGEQLAALEQRLTDRGVVKADVSAMQRLKACTSSSRLRCLCTSSISSSKSRAASKTARNTAFIAR